MKNLLTSIVVLLTVTTSTFTQQRATDAYDSLLHRVVCRGRVDYHQLVNNTELDTIAQLFQSVNRHVYDSLAAPAKLAFLINTYNFYTLKLMADHYPLKTGIRDLSKPWDTKFVPLLGEIVSLNHIEHVLIRKGFGEPRIHFAVNCASIGCPALFPNAFRGEKLEQQLESATKSFLSDVTKNRWDGTTLYLSKIFDWYGDDFNKKYGSYKKFVFARLEITTSPKIKFLNYNWGLNDAGHCP